MANYLRPRRGTLNAAMSQNIKLKRGEVFFECPSTGMGTGIGKIKIGDGVTAYSDLPYFLEQKEIDIAEEVVKFEESTITDSNALLATIKSDSKLNVLVGAIKKLLGNLIAADEALDNKIDSSVSTLNTSINSKAASNHNHNNIYYTKTEVDGIESELSNYIKGVSQDLSQEMNGHFDALEEQLANDMTTISADIRNRDNAITTQLEEVHMTLSTEISALESRIKDIEKQI